VELQRQPPISSSDLLGRSSLVHFKRIVVVFCDGRWRHVVDLASLLKSDCLLKEFVRFGEVGFRGSWALEKLDLGRVKQSWVSGVV